MAPNSIGNLSLVALGTDNLSQRTTEATPMSNRAAAWAIVSPSRARTEKTFWRNFNWVSHTRNFNG